MTKCFFGVDPYLLRDGKFDVMASMVNDGVMVNRVGLSRKHIFDAVEASVKRLVDDYFSTGLMVLLRLWYRVWC